MLKPQKKTQLIILFSSLIFIGIGLPCLVFLCLFDIYDWQCMKSWIPVDAMVVNVKLHESIGENSAAYSVRVNYSYEYQNQKYQHNRVTISSGSDNVYDYHQDLYGRLNKQFNDGEPIRIWLDPNNPQNSIIDREMRWGVFVMRLVFAVILCGIGFFVIGLSYFLGIWKNFNSKKKFIRSNAVNGFIFRFMIMALICSPIVIPFYVYLTSDLVRDNPERFVLLFGAFLPFLIMPNLLLRKKVIGVSYVQWRFFSNARFIPSKYPFYCGGKVDGIIAGLKSYGDDLAGKRFEIQVACYKNILYWGKAIWTCNTVAMLDKNKEIWFSVYIHEHSKISVFSTCVINLRAPNTKYKTRFRVKVSQKS